MLEADYLFKLDKAITQYLIVYNQFVVFSCVEYSDYDSPFPGKYDYLEKRTKSKEKQQVSKLKAFVCLILVFSCL